MNNKPHNPGLSEKAWDDLHLFIAKMQIKHGKKLAERERGVGLTDTLGGDTSNERTTEQTVKKKS